MKLALVFIVVFTAMLNLQKMSALKMANKALNKANSFSLGTARLRNLPEVNVEPTFMFGAVMPGDSTVQLKEFVVPVPAHGQCLIETKASTICGSDIRCIYRRYVGEGQEAYQKGTICGHEPAGIVKEVGEGCKHFKVGDRVIVYHISGCGICSDCRRGFMISCQNDNYRKSYGFQRHGGMAPYILTDEKDLISLPDELSFLDGAQIACGYGTVYEGLSRIEISGTDSVLVMGLGPVGLAALQIAKAMGARQLIGVDTMQERVDLAKKLKLVDHGFLAGKENVEQVRGVTGGKGCEKTVDCTGNRIARKTCIEAARQWGKICFIGEGDTVDFDVSHDLIHPQKTIYGSWVTSIWRMEELVEKIVQWKIRPDELVTGRYQLPDVSKAYEEMAAGKTGKVAVLFGKQ